jgi:hypothetical protein
MGLDPGSMHFCEDAQLFSAPQLKWLEGWAFAGLEGLLAGLSLSTKKERSLHGRSISFASRHATPITIHANDDLAYSFLRFSPPRQVSFNTDAMLANRPRNGGWTICSHPAQEHATVSCLQGLVFQLSSH